MLGCGVSWGVEPPALPFVRQERPDLARRSGLVRAPATITCYTREPLLQQVYLPVRSLDPHVELAKLASHLVGLGTHIGNSQGGQHL